MDYKYLDTYFNENVEPNKIIFDKLTTSNELHYIASNHNWDTGIMVLEWIIENKLCSEATALMIFWHAQPYDFVEYNYNAKDINNGDIKVFNLIKKILENYKSGFYKKTDIKYNPKEDMPENVNIPEIMFEETIGEEPYIYYEEKEVNSWFGEYLERQIERCENAMDLYNIAYLLKYNLINSYKNILDNKYCDKGISLLIYWKLKQLYEFDENEIIDKIINKEYKEEIKYNPKEDKSNKLNRKNKWEIPEIMKKEIT